MRIEKEIPAWKDLTHEQKAVLLVLYEARPDNPIPADRVEALVAEKGYMEMTPEELEDVRFKLVQAKRS